MWQGLSNPVIPDAAQRRSGTAASTGARRGPNSPTGFRDDEFFGYSAACFAVSLPATSSASHSSILRAV